jgi:ABC-type multidrug transport system ATPase subunit
MLNITLTGSTLVGDAFVPGISCGERKRVSSFWDNPTSGLDASTALDFVKC